MPAGKGSTPPAPLRFSLGALLFVGLFAGCSGNPPARLGGLGEPLLPCPGTPNCVRLELGVLATDWEVAAPSGLSAALESAVEALPRTRLVATEVGGGGVYLHAEARSQLLRFVDDLELRVAPGASTEARTLEVRSASRMGQSDLGVNGKRVDRLRALLVDRGLLAP